jgi:hypothetical protein
MASLCRSLLAHPQRSRRSNGGRRTKSYALAILEEFIASSTAGAGEQQQPGDGGLLQHLLGHLDGADLVNTVHKAALVLANNKVTDKLDKII